MNQPPDNNPSSAPARLTALAKGTMVDRYRIQRLLGDSTLGITYDAEDLALLCPVVLRIVPHGMAIEESQRELRSFLDKQRPNFSRQIEVGDYEGSAFIVFGQDEHLQSTEISEPTFIVVQAAQPGGTAAAPRSAPLNGASMVTLQSRLQDPDRHFSHSSKPKLSRRRPVLVAAAVLLSAAVATLWYFHKPKPASPGVPREVVIRQKGPAFSTEPRIAIVVGMGDYVPASHLPHLDWADKDGDEIADTLDPLGYHVERLIGRDALAASITNDLKEAAKSFSNTGTILFFFSGHGIQNPHGQYLMTYDAVLNDPTHPGLSLEQLQRLLEDTGARQRIVIIDACRTSGAKGDGILDLSRVEEGARSAGIRILNSTAPGQASYEDSRFNHSVFTYEILKGLKGGLKTNDGYIFVDDLFQYASEQMRAISDNKGQEPWESVEANGDFILAKVPIAGQPSHGTNSPAQNSLRKDWSKQ